GMPTATIEQRRRAVRGFVYSPYRAPEVFNAILRKSLSTGFEMDVETFNSPEPQVETLIYDSDTSRRWPEHPTHHLKVVQYEVGGRTWSSLITLAPGFESPAEDYAPWLIGLLGTLLSFLLFRLVRNLRVHSKAVEDALMLAALGHDRLEFLYQSTGSVYGSAPDHETVLHRLSEAIVPKLADWSSTVILSEAGETQVSSMVWRRQDKKFEDYFKRSFRPLPDASRRGVARVLATGQPEFIPFLEEEEYGNFTSVPGAIAALREIHPCSYICVPLKARQRTVGAFIAMMSDSGRHYTNDDLTLISEFAAKASAAVENSFLYHDLQKAIEARDDFISVASHELKTPLTTLKLQAQLLQRNLRQAVAEGVTLEQASAQLRKAAEISERQVSRLTRLVDDMLEVSRIRGGKLRFKKEELDLVGLVKEVLDRSAELVSDAGCSLRLREYGPVRGAWDRFRVEQVVLNLLSNAAKYGAGKPIELTVRREDAFAILEVRDHGVGISPADQERIFHRFERATSTQEISGLGLGLFISRQIVEGQGGRIELRSTPGEGSTFIVKLPIDPQLPARPPARTDQPLVLD
ncbi:MAG: ATP-binding protein, partial [Oligoflexia bacterium]|nr:ATP-binding protein [Oligoflexia bacterium]